jgi:exodeoxyribonuclease V alpha subunit
MIDLLLMNALVKAVDITSHLLLVGDPDQLPSVGAGNVLKDLIASAKETEDGSNMPPATRPAPLAIRNSQFESGNSQLATSNSSRVNVVSLSVIFRQSETSLIVSNAHRINQGEMPIFTREAKDFFFFNEPEPEDATNRIVKLLSESLPKHFRLDPINDVQVLSPMHRGVTGVGQLNLALQEALNPAAAGKREWRHGGRVFRVGDKVLQIRNNYEKLVFNGDLGRIKDVDLEEQMLVVDFEGTRVEYEFLEADELTHAFAMSVHKAQGSEYRAVVIPLLTQHYMLLQRNLLYTGVTRAKTLVVLVGTKRAVAMAVKNNKVAQRNSGLVARLREV